MAMDPLHLPYRVIDLTDDRGHLAGLLLAQLGADVIAVEPPEGQRARHLAPFADDALDRDAVGPERALGHRAFNRGKRSVVLTDPSELEALARTADVVIHSDAYPADLAALRALNPRLVTANITAFGETGPKAGWAATDLTLSASSGTMMLTGDDDRAPLRVSVPVVWHFAALDAACGIMLALTERARSGRGQHVSVAAQSSYISTNQLMVTYPLVGAEPTQRVAGGIRIGPLTLQVLNRCADGYVAAGFLFGPVFGPYTIRLWQWVHSEGGCPDRFLDVDWIGLGLAITEDPDAIAIFREGTEVLARFLLTKTKAEVAAATAEHRLLAIPVTTTEDLLDSDHLAERGYWDIIDGRKHNGRMAVFERTPLRTLGSAPVLGAHTVEVLAEIPADADSPTATALDEDPDAERGRPLDGLKVLDFTWAIAGPEATRQFADFGATVIRVESEKKPDPIRGAGPFVGEPGGFENSLSWHSINAGKLSFAVDLTDRSIQPVVDDLIRWADVVVESFSSGVLESLGYGPARMRELNSDVIILSSTLAGQTGPMRELSGFGTTGAAIAGLYPTTGWPDRDPAGPFGPYTDYPSHRFGALTVLAALDHLRRGGGGQHIDYSQAEGAMHLLATALLDNELNGRVGTWRGNADLNFAPHGVYPAAGEDRWIAIGCETDAQWRALAELVGAANADASLEHRHDRAAEIDAAITSWTQDRDVADLENALQSAGVPAHRVATAHDVVDDPQLVHRDFFARVSHPIHGQTWAERKAFELHDTPAVVDRAGPTLGEHVWEVLTLHLGYDDETASTWVATGAFQ